LIEQIEEYLVTSNGASSEDSKVNDIEVKTPFGSLYYPAQWKDNIKINYKDSAGQTIEFISEINGHTSIMLFSLIFGGDDGDQLGVIKSENGVYVPVYLKMGTIEGLNVDTNILDDIYEMQEAVNVLIEQMPLE